MDIALLLTGNELMTGDTIDSNSAFIAKELRPRGFDVVSKITVGDDRPRLVNALSELIKRYKIVIVNGGLGPTSDDLTAEILAEVGDVGLKEHPEAKKHVETWCKEKNITLNPANLKQAVLPETASIIPNPIGSAVGIAMEIKGCQVLCTPGVPGELHAMFSDSIINNLSNDFPQSQSRWVRRLKTFGIGESELQQRLHNLDYVWPKDVTVGFRAGLPLLELKLEVNDKSFLPLRDECEEKLKMVIGDHIVGENDQCLAEVLVSLLNKKNSTVSLAESCTGGKIASEITSISGASDVFNFGVVTYSNEMKEKLLNVSDKTLVDYGAVSKEVVSEMFTGSLLHSGSDYAIAVSGIAGPEGGTIEKPVGTVWIAWGSRDEMKSQRFLIPRTRNSFQLIVTALALDLLRRFILDIGGIPFFFQDKQ